MINEIGWLSHECRRVHVMKMTDCGVSLYFASCDAWAGVRREPNASAHRASAILHVRIHIKIGSIRLHLVDKHEHLVGCHAVSGVHISSPALCS